mgnify:FL=1
MTLHGRINLYTRIYGSENVSRIQSFEKLNFTNVTILFKKNNNATIHYSKTRTALILLYYACTVF